MRTRVDDRVLTPTPNPQPLAPRRTAARRAISLMEVLISMFVLAVGLLGIAALIPAGRHEIVEGIKLENAAMVGRAAFRDIQTRGYLNPTTWHDSLTGLGNFGYRVDMLPIPFTYSTPSNPPDFTLYTNQVAVVLDPLGRTAPAGPYPREFPAGGGTPTIPALRRIVPFQPLAGNLPDKHATFDSIFRGSFDRVIEPNAANADLPPLQKYFNDGTPPPGTINYRRASDGNYSWLATIVSDQTKSALDSELTVSVAVFHKRNLSLGGVGPYNEYQVEVNLPVSPMTSGGEVILRDLPNDSTGNMVSVRPGQWIMLAGRRIMAGVPPNPPVIVRHYRWYRVLSAAPADATARTQQITVAGQDWDCSPVNTRAWIFDNIVAVYEKNLPLEIEY